MRCLIIARANTEAANQLISSGRIAALIQQMLSDIQPEAAYFAPSSGQRTIYLVADLAEASQLATKLEPFWLALRAEVEIIPVMTGEDLQRGIEALTPVLGKYTT
jgi:hypothetical protein